MLNVDTNGLENVLFVFVISTTLSNVLSLALSCAYWQIKCCPFST